MQFQKSIGVVCVALVLLLTSWAGQSVAGQTKKPLKPPISDKTSMMISADTTGIIVPSPAGYAMDSDAAKRVGVPAAYHPKGKTWLSADAVMYVNFSPRSEPGIKGVDAAIAQDIQSFKDYSSTATATPVGTGKTNSGITYKLVDFKGVGKSGAEERIAYLDTKDNIARLVLSAKTKAGFQAALPSYMRWLKTAVYVAVPPTQ